MNQINERLAHARHLFENRQPEAAEATLQEALQAAPGEPSLTCELAILYCYTQREAEAAALLQRCQGAERFAELVKILADHAACRETLASKLRVIDPLGPKIAQATAPFLQGYTPISDVSVTACLIVKNEEAHLDRCLKSLEGFADEIVVVDTGSTDRTIDIAVSYGAKIGHFKWCDDFAAARNASLELATGRWALWIDADEEIAPGSLNALREGLIRPQFGGYFIRIVNFLSDTSEGSQYVHTPVRLFQNLPGVSFQGRIHEQVLPSIAKLGMKTATLSDATLNHYGYRPSEMESKNKLDRTISMLEREVKAHPDNAFHWFNLANAFSVAGIHDRAEQAALKANQFAPSDASYIRETYQILVSAQIGLGKFEQALETCDEAEKRGAHSILNEFERGLALFKLYRNEEALQSIDKCFQMDWPEGLTGDYGIFTHKRHLLKGQILSQMDRYDEALPLFDFALGIDPDFDVCLFSKAATLENMGRFDEAQPLYAQAVGSKNVGRQCRKGLARTTRYVGELTEAAKLFHEAWQEAPQEEDCWYGWTSCLEELGDQPGLIGAYQALAEHRDLSADMLINWGRAYQATGEVEVAFDKYTQAIELEPNSPNAYFNCGDLLFALGKFEDATQVYQHALQLDPANAQGWFVLGNSLAHMNVLAGAKVAFSQALVISPEHEEAKHNLDVVEEMLAGAA
jgi:tetratricopeptide (TPR) repeat protein